MNYHELTVRRYYSRAMIELQDLVPVAHRKRKLKNELKKRRPKYFRKKIWDEAIIEIVNYTKSHKHNFANGRLTV